MSLPAEGVGLWAVPYLVQVRGLPREDAFGAILDHGWQGEVAAGVRLYSPADFRLGIALLFACTLAGLTLSFFIRERAPALRAVEPRQS